jgi:hypothetical protein
MNWGVRLPIVDYIMGTSRYKSRKLL